MCNCNPIIPLTDEVKRKVNVLKFMLFGYAVLLIALIATGGIESIFSYIISILCVLAAAFQANYQYCGIGVLFSFLNGFSSFLFLALRVQNAILNLNEPLKIKYNGLFVMTIIIHCVSFIFHLLLIYFLFDSYKEFKATYKNNSYKPIPSSNYDNERLADFSLNNDQEKKFPGSGTKLGGT